MQVEGKRGRTSSHYSEAHMTAGQRYLERRRRALNRAQRCGSSRLGERAQFQLQDASVGGRGLQPEFQNADWQRIREAAYEGRGG